MLFIYAWEQRRLGEVANIFDGTHQTPQYVSSGIKFVSVENIATLESKKFISEEAYNKEYANKQAEKGDVLMTRIGDIGTSKIIEADEALAYYVTLALLKPKEIVSDFLAHVISSPKVQDDIWKRTLHVAFPKKINLGEINQVDVVMPSSAEEQSHIGTFFRTLDNTIAIHKRKLDGLRELKKAYLQVMFPQAGEVVPRVRFEGFTEPWVQVALEEIAERVTRKNTKLESTLPLTISAQHGLIDQTEFFNKQVASRDVSGYFLVKKGEFAYNKSYSNGYPWGAVKRLDKYEMGVLSTLYIVFKPIDVDSEFMVQYYETDNWHTEIIKYAAEGARNHGLLNITPTDFFKTVLAIPSTREEQKAIGSFFEVLDKQITVQHEKVGQLGRLKSAYLQKMFV